MYVLEDAANMHVCDSLGRRRIDKLIQRMQLTVTCRSNDWSCIVLTILGQDVVVL